MVVDMMKLNWREKVMTNTGTKKMMNGMRIHRTRGAAGGPGTHGVTPKVTPVDMERLYLNLIAMEMLIVLVRRLGVNEAVQGLVEQGQSKRTSTGLSLSLTHPLTHCLFLPCLFPGSLHL